MSKKFFCIFLLLFSINYKDSFANDDVLVSDPQAKQMEEEVAGGDNHLKETQGLYKELELLQAKMEESEKENEKLQQEVDVYKKKEQITQFRQKKMEDLIKIIKESILSETYGDKNYGNAVNAVLREDYNGAEESLKLVLDTSLDTYMQSISETKKDNTLSNSRESKALRLPDDKKEAEVAVVLSDEDKEKIKKDYQKLINQTNMVLGYLSLNNEDYMLAISHFSKAYKDSSNVQVIISSIATIAEIFDFLDKSSETCISIKGLEDSMDSIKKQNSKIIIDQRYYDLAKNLKTKNSCMHAVNVALENKKAVDDKTESAK